jgi:hypothetical protein
MSNDSSSSLQPHCRFVHFGLAAESLTRQTPDARGWETLIWIDHKLVPRFTSVGPAAGPTFRESLDKIRLEIEAGVFPSALLNDPWAAALNVLFRKEHAHEIAAEQTAFEE